MRSTKYWYFHPSPLGAGLRRPGVHGVGHGRGGEGVAVAESEVRVGSLERIDILDVVALLCRGREGEECRRAGRQEAPQRTDPPERSVVVMVCHVVCRFQGFTFRNGLLRKAPGRVGLGTHEEFERAACGDLREVDVRGRELLAVEAGPLDVDVFGRVVVRHDL